MPAAAKEKRPVRQWSFGTVADLVKHLGVPPNRIRMTPTPGTATERDARLRTERDRPCELIDGVLVEKALGLTESILAMYLGRLLGEFAERHRLGVVAGEAGLVRLAPGQVRAPDICFIAWDTLPGRKLPTRPVPRLTPDLVVEVLSKGKTKREMDRKRRDYFRASGKLFWEVDPKKRVVRVFTAPGDGTTLTESDTLDGGAVLPGFTLRLRDLFGQLDRRK